MTRHLGATSRHHNDSGRALVMARLMPPTMKHSHAQRSAAHSSWAAACTYRQICGPCTDWNQNARRLRDYLLSLSSSALHAHDHLYTICRLMSAMTCAWHQHALHVHDDVCITTNSCCSCKHTSYNTCAPVLAASVEPLDSWSSCAGTLKCSTAQQCGTESLFRASRALERGISSATDPLCQLPEATLLL